MTEDVSVMFQKGLSEWWSEETEYIFQRIERWAAYARGYNRLRSQRLSRGRMTMQGGQEPRWSISSNKIIIDDSSWSPRFHTLKKSRRKSRPEEAKINCCGTFNYRSNSSLDSTCLEAYRYDHSIYFKTIGDIKNGKKAINVTKNEPEEDKISISSEELVEWDVDAVSDFIADQLLENSFANDNEGSFFQSAKNNENANEPDSITWWNVDLSKLDLTEQVDAVSDDQSAGNNWTAAVNEEENNNCVQNGESVLDTNKNDRAARLKEAFVNGNDVDRTHSENEIQRITDVRRIRMSTPIKQSVITGDNDVTWPSVLLNYTRNIDPSISPHHFKKPQVSI